jgi:hypothetical protein
VRPGVSRPHGSSHGIVNEENSVPQAAPVPVLLFMRGFFMFSQWRGRIDIANGRESKQGQRKGNPRPRPSHESDFTHPSAQVEAYMNRDRERERASSVPQQPLGSAHPFSLE